MDFNHRFDENCRSSGLPCQFVIVLLQDLISLLDAGLSASEHPSVIIDAERLFSEDMLAGYSSRRTFGRGGSTRERDFRTTTAERESACPDDGSNSNSSDRESRESLSRSWRDRGYGASASSSGGRDLTTARWLGSALRETIRGEKDSGLLFRSFFGPFPVPNGSPL